MVINAETNQAVIVQVDFGIPFAQDDFREFKQLVLSSGTDIVDCFFVKRKIPNPKYFLGTGKVDEILSCIETLTVDVILFNHTLSPTQERNLENKLQRRVLSRSALILDIFAQRAQSFEGKLQVELAQLQYLSTRLVRGWTHLERQKGGIGLRGPGETQLETDRRLIGMRIKQIKKRLHKVGQQRTQARRSRTRAKIPTVSLVGYTNAGKSTLFNRLTGGNTLVADQLFATLDPTLRKINLPNSNESVILADTVGFIRQLPHDLIAAFKATLQETTEADLLIHVIDTSHPEYHQQIQQVQQVIKEIAADDIPMIAVYNKIDTLNIPAKYEYNQMNKSHSVWLSAKTGEGKDLLLARIVEYFHADYVCKKIRIPASAGKVRAHLFNIGTVKNEKTTKNGDWLIEIDLPRQHINYLIQQEQQNCCKIEPID